MHNLIQNVEALAAFSDNMRKERVDGGTLNLLESAEELQDFGIDNNLKAKRFIKQVETWKTEGVPTSSLSSKLPDPNSLPPYPSSPSNRRPSVIISALKGGIRSSGETTVVDGTFRSGSRKDAPVKVKLGRDREVLFKEYELADSLNCEFPNEVIKTLAFVDGVDITSRDKNDDCSQLCGFVMEAGSQDLAKYLRETRGLKQTEKTTIVDFLVTMISHVHSLNIVLMDFKLSNVVRVFDGREIRLKAIDFDSARKKDENITIKVSYTPNYVSPEVAKVMLARRVSSQTGEFYASQKIDIWCLGCCVFELFNERLQTLWECLGVRVGDDMGILEMAARLTDADIERAVETQYPGEGFSGVRSFMLSALKIEPFERLDAILLQNKNLFNSGGATVSIGRSLRSMEAKMEKFVTKEDLEKIMERVIAKMDAIAESQEGVGIAVRQMLFDNAERHAELKLALSAINTSLESFSSLEPAAFEGLSADEMKQLIQSSVKKSVEEVSSVANLGESVKNSIIDTMKQCSEGTNMTEGTNDEIKSQLTEMSKVLLDLRADMKNLVGEIKEVRKELKDVTLALGTLNTLVRTLVDNEHGNPTLILVTPANASASSRGLMGKMKSKVTNFFANEMVVTFVCPITKKPAKSGPEGKGYRLVIPKAFVKKLAPVIAISFALVKIAIETYGIPFPCPLPSGFTTDSYIEAAMEQVAAIAGDATEVMSEGSEVTEEVAEAFEEVQSALDTCKGKKSLRNIEQKKMNIAVEGGTAISYLAVRDLLILLEKAKDVNSTWQPKQTGLIRHTSKKDGSSTWVSAESIPKFDAEGADSFI